MKFNEYQDMAIVTMRSDLTREQRLANWSMGLAGESGELVEEIKKVLFHGKKLDIDRVVKELGDVVWYVAALAYEFGLPLDQVAKANLVKLAARHGQAFKRHDEQNR